MSPLIPKWDTRSVHLIAKPDKNLSPWLTFCCLHQTEVIIFLQQMLNVSWIPMLAAKEYCKVLQQNSVNEFLHSQTWCHFNNLHLDNLNLNYVKVQTEIPQTVWYLSFSPTFTKIIPNINKWQHSGKFRDLTGEVSKIGEGRLPELCIFKFGKIHAFPETPETHLDPPLVAWG